MIFSSTKQAILTIERSESLLQQKQPDEVLVAGMGSLGELIAQVCCREQRECKISDGRGRLMSETLSDETKIMLGRFLLRVKEFRRKRMAKHEHTRSDSKRPKVLFLSPSPNWRSIWSYKNDRYEKADVFMGGIIAEMQRQDFEIICVDVDYSLTGHVGLLKEKILSDGMRWVSFEHYMNGSIDAKLKSNPNYAQLSHAFGLLDHSEEFQYNLQYRSILLWKYLRGRFRRAMSGLHALHEARLIEIAREMLRVESPDAIAMSYENGAYALAVIVAAWRRGIPTLGVQHGFISPTNVEYMHPSPARSETELGCPIPTKTALGGQYSVDLLTQLGSYPKESVMITGYTKHDYLAELELAESKLDRGKLLGDVRLDPARKTIMIASGGFHSKYGWTPEYDREVLERMVNLSTSRPDIQLLVRLHPMEDGTMQREVTERVPGRAAIVKGERNDLLWASDMLVTVNSVVALDALILGKPVMMLEGASEDVSTVDLGKAAILYTLENLNDRVINLIQTSGPSDQIRREMQLEISRHANSVDGRARYRVAALLKELATSHPHGCSSRSIYTDRIN